MSAIVDDEAVEMSASLLASVLQKCEARTLHQAAAIYSQQQYKAEGFVRKTIEKVRLMSQQDFRCVFCNADFLVDRQAFASATIDHVRPRSVGGKNNFSNLRVACTTFNFVKGNSAVETVDDARSAIGRRLSLLELWLD